MKNENLYDFIYSLDLENEDITEFFIHYCNEVVNSVVSGVEYGLTLAGKDMDSDEGKEVMAEIRTGYENTFPNFVEKTVKDFADYALAKQEEEDLFSTIKGKTKEELKPVDYVIPICKMLQKGYDINKICEVLKYNNKLFISNIKNRRIYKNISKDYTW